MLNFGASKHGVSGAWVLGTPGSATGVDLFVKRWKVISRGEITSETRMHSSRMRTGRSLTVLGKFGNLETPPQNWRPPEKLETHPPPKNWRTPSPPEKLENPPPGPDPPKKFGEPPTKLEDPPKIWRTPRDQTTHPPENLENPPGPDHHPPKKNFGDPPKNWRPPGTRPTPPPRGQNSWHTLLKILPWPNFVAAGNKYVHWVPLTKSSVATSTRLQRKINFLSKSLHNVKRRLNAKGQWNLNL